MADKEEEWLTHHKTMKKLYMEHHNQMMDHFRSIEDIVKEGSDPSSKSRFKSSSPRDAQSERDAGESPLGGKTW